MADRLFHATWCGKGTACTCRSVEQDCPFDRSEKTKIRTTYTAAEVSEIARESFLAGLWGRDKKAILEQFKDRPFGDLLAAKLLSDEELVGSDAVPELQFEPQPAVTSAQISTPRPVLCVNCGYEQSEHGDHHETYFAGSITYQNVVCPGDGNQWKRWHSPDDPPTLEERVERIERHLADGYVLHLDPYAHE